MLFACHAVVQPWLGQSPLAAHLLNPDLSCDAIVAKHTPDRDAQDAAVASAPCKAGALLWLPCKRVLLSLVLQLCACRTQCACDDCMPKR